MKFVQPPAVPHRNLFLYGPPKSGKTGAVATAPGPVLLVNADLPNATWYAHTKSAQDHLNEVQYEGFKTLVEITDQVHKGTIGMETVWVDPVNELYRELLEELSGRAVQPTLPTYLAVQTHLERFFRALCKAPNINAVFVAHETPVKDEGSGIFERLPATGTTNPSLGQKLMGMVDIIGYTAMTEVEGQSKPVPQAQLVNAKGRRGGDRFDVLGPVRDLNLTEWFDLAAAAVNNGNQPQETTENV